MYSISTGRKVEIRSLKEVEEKLAGLQDELTKKIRPEISAGAPSEVTASSESSTGSPRSKKVGRENKPMVRFLAMFLDNKLTAKIQKSTADSVSDPLVGSKSPVLEQSTAGSDLDPLVESKAPVLEQSTAGSDSNPLVESNALVLEQSTNGSESREENLEINIEGKSPSTTGSDPLVGSKAPVLEQKPEISTTGCSENQIEEAEEKGSMDQIKEVLVSKPQENHSREVYISGKRGMGKSTLVRKLYNDPDIRKSFEVSGWVPVGHNFQIKRVLQLLLQQLQGPQQEQQPDLRKMNEMELISQIFYAVKDKSYLLVLDDVGSMKDWESISLALPLANSTRVIITSSSNDFDKCTNHYKISGLTRSQTLTLWNKEGISFDPKVGEAIYEISGGSPLYATILGKSLVSEAKDKQLIEELDKYEIVKRGTPRVLNASYRRLAPELKPCFLYLGLFPPFQDIQVDKLYLLLLAENLIPSSEESEKSLDHYLKEYLDKLADLRLVEVEEDVQSRSGLYKSCRLHDQVQEFCISKGFDEEFLEVVEFKTSSKQVVVGSHTRRLAIYMRNYRGGGTSISFKGDASVKKILSLLVFDTFESAEGKSGWPSGIGDLTEFTHLRVLNFEEVNFQLRKLPKGMEKLLLLRYLSIGGCFLEELPSYLGGLKQLETLDLLVRDDCCIIIPDNIFTSLKRLVHLYLPRQYRRNGETKLTLRGLEMLETLINFDTEIFEAGDLSQLEKLKILSTISNGENPEEMDAVINLLNKRASQLQHSSVEIRSFDCYDRGSVSALKKLLQCRFVHSVRIEGEIGELPEEEDGSGGGGERVVSEMVLHGSELELNPMGYFGRFRNLRSLVLADNAFLGTDIVISSSPLFPKLRSLKLRNLQYLETLTIEEGALPELSSLKIESCGDALDLTIPKELYLKLKNEIGGDAYSVVPSRRLSFNTTP